MSVIAIPIYREKQSLPSYPVGAILKRIASVASSLLLTC